VIETLRIVLQSLEDSNAPPDDVVIKTLLLIDLVDSTSIVDQLGDMKAAAILSRYDRIARDLLSKLGGREIDKTDGFLLLFDRPIDAVRYALEFHEALHTFSEECGIPVRVRVGIHLGEVIMRKNSPDDIARGAKPVEVEGLTKFLAARLAQSAEPGQTLLTQTAYQLAHRATIGDELASAFLNWTARGSYALKGISEPVDVFEVSLEGRTRDDSSNRESA
jgi:class 3 adenylate cyclase